MSPPPHAMEPARDPRARTGALLFLFLGSGCAALIFGALVGTVVFSLVVIPGLGTERAQQALVAAAAAALVVLRAARRSGAAPPPCQDR